MPHALPPLAPLDESLISRASLSSRSLSRLSSREPLRTSISPPHPLLAPLNALLAALLIPLQLPSLQLATPTLLLSALEAVLETRIEDVPDAWRGSWDRAHRRAVTLVLVRAIDEVEQGLTRRLRVAQSGAVEDLAWRADDVDVEEVVRGREHEVAKLVAALLGIAEALGIVPARAKSPATPKAHHRTFLHPDATLPSPTRTPTPLPALPLQTTLPSSGELPRENSPPSPTPRRRVPPTEPTTLFAPRPLRASRAAPPAAARTPSPTPPEPAAAVPSSFLAEVAAHRWRSPPPPVSPLSPRRRGERVLGELEVERREGERRSTLEVLRRRMEEALAAPVVPALEPAWPEKGKARADDAQSERAVSPALDQAACCDACGASARRQKPARSGRERSSASGTAASSSSSGYSASSSSEVDDTFAPASSVRSARTPTRRARPLVPCTCARPPPPRLPPLGQARKPSRTASASITTASTATSATSRPRRVRLTRLAPSLSSRSRTLPPKHILPSAGDDPSPAELSLHSSTDIDAHESLLAARAPPPAVTPPAARQEEAGDEVQGTPSPYTLILLAHRARLREKLALLERRERDRREAAAEQAAVEGGGVEGMGLRAGWGVGA